MTDAPRSRSFPYVVLMIPACDPTGIQERWWTCDIMGVEMRDENEHIEIQRVYFEDEARMRDFLLWQQRTPDTGEVIGAGSVEYTDWESFLHGGFEPFRVGDLFVVPAENPPPIPAGCAPLRINPGRGFGTGSHPTTRLSMEFLAQYWRRGDILDVGAGSGILSIQAALMGSERVVAVDTDADSVENAVENVELNGLQERITLRTGSIEQVDPGGYSLVLANIIAPILRKLLRDRLLDYLTPDGTLIFSGILHEELKDFIAFLRSYDLTIVQERQMKEWCAVVVRK